MMHRIMPLAVVMALAIALVRPVDAREATVDEAVYWGGVQVLQPQMLESSHRTLALLENARLVNPEWRTDIAVEARLWGTIHDAYQTLVVPPSFAAFDEHFGESLALMDQAGVLLERGIFEFSEADLNRSNALIREATSELQQAWPALPDIDLPGIAVAPAAPTATTGPTPTATPSPTATVTTSPDTGASPSPTSTPQTFSVTVSNNTPFMIKPSGDLSGRLFIAAGSYLVGFTCLDDVPGIMRLLPQQESHDEIRLASHGQAPDTTTLDLEQMGNFDVAVSCAADWQLVILPVAGDEVAVYWAGLEGADVQRSDRIAGGRYLLNFDCGDATATLSLHKRNTQVLVEGLAVGRSVVSVEGNHTDVTARTNCNGFWTATIRPIH